jgi:hypothetical protein
MWQKGSKWMLTQAQASSTKSKDIVHNVGEEQSATPSWMQNIRHGWMTWVPSSLASSLATWNMAASSLKGQELNEIVDDLIEKLS